MKLSYISIFIEYIFVNFIIENIGLSAHLITFPFVVRIFFLTIAILSESKYAYKIVGQKESFCNIDCFNKYYRDIYRSEIKFKQYIFNKKY